MWREFRELDREAGGGKGSIDRGVLLHRGESDGIDEHDVRVAIAIYTLAGDLKPNGARLTSGKRNGWGQSPKEQLERVATPGRFVFKLAADYIDSVGDIISRRNDGRAASPEPIRAYPKALESLGLHGLVPWWKSVAAELHITDPQKSPTTIIVLSAALAEAALCSLLERAKTSMAKTAFWDRDPKSWKFITLLKEARSGQDPVFDVQRSQGRRAQGRNHISPDQLIRLRS